MFSVAHAGVTCTPSTILFTISGILPLGLMAGYLMRATQSMLTPGMFHSALDMGIYAAFLSYAV